MAVEEAIFNTARRIASPEERQAYLARACGEDVKLHRRLAALLAVDQSFLETPLAARLGDELPERAGSVVGGYKLLEEIGEGGFGIVYMAEDTERRQVALKIVKPGMDTRQVLARFDAERQALAMMEHPNIARVLEAGVLPSGRPWFAMELVRGTAITDFCDREKLSIRERLALAIDVARAVEHAHQKGVIHRDLKPSNVLALRHDGAAVVKVIDFGIAKALTGPLTDRTLFTSFARMLGTPLYMSPEQMDGSGDIDTRTDVYALGVLIYELLTGTPPFGREQFREAGFEEIQQIVRETVPPRPSQRIDTLADTATITANRHSDSRRLSRSLRGDLDWIVMKCLEKDRRRRYPTASDLARDLERHLAAEPVDARPPSVAYRFGRFLQRNRGMAIAAAAVLIALVGGIVGTSWGLIRAREAEKAERNRANSESEQRQRAEAAEHTAQEELGFSNAVGDFLEYDLLGQAGSGAQARRGFEPNPNLTMREALDRAAAGLEAKFAGKLEVQARLRRTLGHAYRELGEPKQAAEQFRLSAHLFKRLRGSDNRDTLAARHSLAAALHDDGKYVESVPLFEELHRTHVTLFTASDADTLKVANSLALAYCDTGRHDEAVLLLNIVHKETHRVRGEKDPATLTALGNLATAEAFTGQPQVAVQRHQKVLDLYRETRTPLDPQVLAARKNLAIALGKAGRMAEGLKEMKEVHEATKRTLPEHHPQRLDTAESLAAMLFDAGQRAEGLPILRDIVEIRKVRQGETHLKTLHAKMNLGAAFLAEKRVDEAIALLEPVRAEQRKQRGETDFSTLFTTAKLAMAYGAAERRREQVELLEQVHRDGRRFKLRWASDALFECYRVAQKTDAALALLHQLIADDRERLEPDDLERAVQFSKHGFRLMQLKRWTEAELILAEAYKIRNTKEPDGWLRFHYLSLHGASYLGQRNFAEAEPKLLAAVNGFKAWNGATTAEFSKLRWYATERVMQLYQIWNKPDEAAKWAAELKALKKE